MKSSQISFGLNSLGAAAVALLLLTACKPGQKDPAFDYTHIRQDAKVQNLDLSGNGPLNAIGVSTLWSKTTGRASDGNRVRIAMIGTGIDYTIPDLRDSLWINVAESDEHSRADGFDNDLNGYADDVMGYDFFSGDNMPYDWHGHDTYVASLIAATARTNAKVVGMAPNAELMILRYIGPDGRVNGASGAIDCEAAFEYAIANGAKIIYLNWPQGGFKTGSALVVNAIKAAGKKNILVVIPSGNTANEGIPTFMKDLNNQPNVLVVAGLASDGRLRSDTNSGRNLASLAAPAEGAVGYLNGGEVAVGAITTSSVAAAYVVGSAALLSTLPQYGSVEKIRNALMTSAVNPNKSEPPLNVLAGGALYLGSF